MGSVFEAPLGAAWGTQEAGLAWGCTKGDGGKTAGFREG